MLVRELRPRPHSWSQFNENRSRVMLPFHALEWSLQWSAYYLSRWALLEVLEYLSILSVIFAVIFYFTEAGDRQKQKHYQAWQVINTAQGKGGSGGRIEALQELNEDRVPLVGVDVSGAFLQGVRLPAAKLLRANLEAADLRDCNLAGADLEFADLKSANFRQADLSRTKLQAADLTDADLVNADLTDADLTGATLDSTDLRNVNLAGARWNKIRSVKNANVQGLRNAPEGFLAWAMQHGAVVRPDEE